VASAVSPFSLVPTEAKLSIPTSISFSKRFANEID
jgi:hypothetical protein